MSDKAQYEMIDPPFNPYSATEQEVKDWISELESRPESDGRDMALSDARIWLEMKKGESL